MSVVIIHILTLSDDDWSGDDPPRVCDVQSVKDYPGCSPCDLHDAGHHTRRHM